MRKFKLVIENENNDQEFTLYDEQKNVVFESNDQDYRVNQAIEVFERTLKYLNVEYVIDIERV